MRKKKKISIKLGKHIKALRHERGMSLTKLLLEKDGVTPATWSRVENGIVDVKFTTLINIAATLNMTVEEVIADLDIDYTIYEN